MRKIYDTIMGFNEIDLVKLRMEILNDSVDYFVISEAPITFSGHEKPLYFYENRDKFAKFAHKIIHNVFAEDKPEWDQWNRERAQRNGTMDALARSNANDDDIVFYSDADEIWNPDKIDFSNFKDDILYICYQKVFYYYLNTEWYEFAYPDKDTWSGSRYASYGLSKQHTFDTLRDKGSYFLKDNQYKKEYIDSCGWHFSFLGGADNVKLKLSAYSHQEMNIPVITNNIQNNINALRDPFFRPNFGMRVIPFNEKTHPKYLVEHLNDYDKYIYKGIVNE